MSMVHRASSDRKARRFAGRNQNDHPVLFERPVRSASTARRLDINFPVANPIHDRRPSATLTACGNRNFGPASSKASASYRRQQSDLRPHQRTPERPLDLPLADVGHELLGRFAPEDRRRRLSVEAEQMRKFGRHNVGFNERELVEPTLHTGQLWMGLACEVAAWLGGFLTSTFRNLYQHF